MDLIRDYVVALTAAAAETDLAVPPVDTTGLEIRYLEAALGAALPAILGALRMTSLKSRADLFRLAIGLQSLGV
jgi:hypothetical protein